MAAAQIGRLPLAPVAAARGRDAQNEAIQLIRDAVGLAAGTPNRNNIIKNAIANALITNGVTRLMLLPGEAPGGAYIQDVGLNKVNEVINDINGQVRRGFVIPRGTLAAGGRLNPPAGAAPADRGGGDRGGDDKQKKLNQYKIAEEYLTTLLQDPNSSDEDKKSARAAAKTTYEEVRKLGDVDTFDKAKDIYTTENQKRQGFEKSSKPIMYKRMGFGENNYSYDSSQVSVSDVSSKKCNPENTKLDNDQIVTVKIGPNDSDTIIGKIVTNYKSGNSVDDCVYLIQPISFDDTGKYTNKINEDPILYPRDKIITSYRFIDKSSVAFEVNNFEVSDVPYSSIVNPKYPVGSVVTVNFPDESTLNNVAIAGPRNGVVVQTIKNTSNDNNYYLIRFVEDVVKNAGYYNPPPSAKGGSDIIDISAAALVSMITEKGSPVDYAVKASKNVSEKSVIKTIKEALSKASEEIGNYYIDYAGPVVPGAARRAPTAPDGRLAGAPAIATGRIDDGNKIILQNALKNIENLDVNVRKPINNAVTFVELDAALPAAPVAAGGGAAPADPLALIRPALVLGAVEVTVFKEAILARNQFYTQKKAIVDKSFDGLSDRTDRKDIVYDLVLRKLIDHIKSNNITSASIAATTVGGIYSYNKGNTTNDRIRNDIEAVQRYTTNNDIRNALTQIYTDYSDLDKDVSIKVAKAAIIRSLVVGADLNTIKKAGQNAITNPPSDDRLPVYAVYGESFVNFLDTFKKEDNNYNIYKTRNGKIVKLKERVAGKLINVKTTSLATLPLFPVAAGPPAGGPPALPVTDSSYYIMEILGDNLTQEEKEFNNNIQQFNSVKSLSSNSLDNKIVEFGTLTTPPLPATVSTLISKLTNAITNKALTLTIKPNSFNVTNNTVKLSVSAGIYLTPTEIATLESVAFPIQTLNFPLGALTAVSTTTSTAPTPPTPMILTTTPSGAVVPVAAPPSRPSSSPAALDTGNSTEFYINVGIQALYNIEEVSTAVLNFTRVVGDPPSVEKTNLEALKDVFSKISNGSSPVKTINDSQLAASVIVLRSGFTAYKNDKEYNKFPTLYPYYFFDYLLYEIVLKDTIRNSYTDFNKLYLQFATSSFDNIFCLNGGDSSSKGPFKTLKIPIKDFSGNVRDIKQAFENYTGDHYGTSKACDPAVAGVNSVQKNNFDFTGDNGYVVISLERLTSSGFLDKRIDPNDNFKVANKFREFELTFRSVICYPYVDGTINRYDFYAYKPPGKYTQYSNDYKSKTDIDFSTSVRDKTHGIYFIYKIKKIKDFEEEAKKPEPEKAPIELIIKDKDGKELTQVCTPGANSQNPCPEPFNGFPTPPPRINERESLYYNLLNSKVGQAYLQKVKKEDFYYVLKKFTELDPIKDKIDMAAYFQMMTYYIKNPQGQWIQPRVVAAECWKLYVGDSYLHDAARVSFEDDKMLRLIFFLMRHSPDANLYIDEPGNPNGKIHIIPYLYLYFRNPRIYGVKMTGKEKIVTLMQPEKFLKIMIALKLLNVDMESPIYQNDASQGYNKTFIYNASMSEMGERPMKNVQDYVLRMESLLGTAVQEGVYYTPTTKPNDYQNALVYLLQSDYYQFRNNDLKLFVTRNKAGFIKPCTIIYYAYLLDDTSLAFYFGYPEKGYIDTRSRPDYKSDETDRLDTLLVNLEDIIKYNCENIMKAYIPLLESTEFEFETRELVTAINGGSYDAFELLLKERIFPITYFTVNRIIHYLNKYQNAYYPGFDVYFKMLGLIINHGVRFDKFQQKTIETLGKIDSKSDVKYDIVTKDNTKDKKNDFAQTKSSNSNSYYNYFMDAYQKLKLYQKICGMPNNAEIPTNIKEYLYCAGIDITQDNQKICKDLVALREKFSDTKGELKVENIRNNAYKITVEYLKKVIPDVGNNLDKTSGNWNSKDYDEKMLAKYDEMYDLNATPRNPLEYNPDTLVWFQVETEKQQKQQQQQSPESSDGQQQQQQKGSKYKTYIFPAYRFRTLIDNGTFIDSDTKKEVEIPIDAINRMKNKLEFFQSNDILVSNIVRIQAAFEKFFITPDTIDNDETTYIFNSILRLCQSYGYNYNDLSGLSLSDMSRILYKYGTPYSINGIFTAPEVPIIRGNSTNMVFRDLNMHPLSDRINVSSNPTDFDIDKEELVNKSDEQHITFYRYLYKLFERYPSMINIVINDMFAKKNPIRFM